jgi:hypothetical protein
MARDALPVPDRHASGLTTYDAKDPDSLGATAAMIFSADDTCDVPNEGGALGAPVPNDFTGEVRWVEIDVGAAADDADHMLDSDELLRVAMARQ